MILKVLVFASIVTLSGCAALGYTDDEAISARDAGNLDELGGGQLDPTPTAKISCAHERKKGVGCLVWKCEKDSESDCTQFMKNCGSIGDASGSGDFAICTPK